MYKLVMTPATGERVLRFVGDHVHFALRLADGRTGPEDWRAFLRTNLGRAEIQRTEIIQAYTGRLPLAGASWRDIPLQRQAGEWSLVLPLHEVGYFKAKAYASDARGRQYWPEGPDVGISIHPDAYRTANIIYCAFVRLFGASRFAAVARNDPVEAQYKALDKIGVTVIPPSGKLRDLIRQVPHILQTLGCRILHLLPINPTPTTYARMGRYGSPYACLDFTAIDPALVEFDRQTTGVDQFCELTYAVHSHGGHVFLDLAINHTGWGSTFQENHPEWFLRNGEGMFVSPGAWGNTWEDLVELSHRTPDLWDCLAEAFLVWCRRGVDGFRCDAGYKVPAAAWQYIIARVRQEFPETIFLLEGLGGSWEATENLLADGGMQWAYSELFQNYSGREVASYLDYSLRQSQRAGIWVHYSETHDNNRLAARGRAWSLLRNRLCALASASGGFGFTCGVEWLAAEKIVVHRCSGLAWDNGDNLVAELGKMNQLLAEHPCFFDGAICARLSPVDSPVYALRRDSSEGADRVLVLVNTDVEHPQKLCLSQAVYREIGEPAIDLLGQRPPQCQRLPNGEIEFSLEAGASFCLAAVAHPKGLGGAAYRQARARAAWALTALSHHIAPEQAGGYNWRVLADLVAGAGPERFLAALPELGQEQAQTDLGAAIGEVLASSHYPKVIHWNVADSQRVLLVPPDHWLLLSDTAPFRATLRAKNGARIQHTASIVVTGRHYACYAPNWTLGAATLSLERFAAENHHAEGQVQFLPVEPGPLPVFPIAGESGPVSPDLGMVLLTNGYGGMARLNVDLGGIKSKYDCLLAANLHPEWPVDRHVLAKRVRVWVSADGFLSPLDGQNLVAFTPGPPACWHFVANAGDGRSVEVHLEADMLDQRNTTVLRFSRSSKPPCKGKDLPADCAVYLTVRVEIEDRNFHAETKRDPGADHHFRTHCRMLPDRIGFVFQPASDRRLRVFSSAGLYHPQEEWSHQIPHPVELSRGQVASGDAYSPGWFELPLAKGAVVTVTICADPTNPTAAELRDFARRRRRVNEAVLRKAPLASNDAFGQQLVLATQAFLVRRGQGKTIIAGYPWFLDWGRDALICARGLLAAGMIQDVIHLLTTFGCLVENGTLPNSVQGDNTTNRDSSDAPLWFGLVCEEANGMAQKTSALKTSLYELVVDARGGTIGHILRQIAKAYIHGTYHGIQMDPGSGLIFSPTHFTWMDTNYPACTPREGYPVEIQVLWIRLLRQLARLDQSTPHRSEAAHPSPRRPESWLALAERAQRSFHELFWLEDRGYWADLLIAKPGAPAKAAVVDNSLRSNYLLAISLDLVTGEHARRGVEAALLYLVVPGALRSLAPLPVSPPLPIHGHDGRLLNNPELPYWGRYEGNEDTQRKPAYHNGTAWTWTFPIFCEALAKAWNFSPSSVATAKAYLSSIVHLLAEGCLGHIPEILDGDAPHQQRGCDAQAWGATEALRVWKMLTESEH